METTYILTAELDAESYAWLNDLRRQHFPRDRNFLSAHLTLFHRLSSAQIARLRSIDVPCAPVEVHFDGVIFLGFGVAIRAKSAELVQLRSLIRAKTGSGLSRQDSHPWKPHITVQNKVPAVTARQLQHTLQGGFAERAGAATGLHLWEYLGGPWKLVERIAFGNSQLCPTIRW